jgi:hypothetical protein
MRNFLVIALALLLSACISVPPQGEPNNRCNGIAGVRVSPNIQAEVRYEPSNEEPSFALIDNSWGWMTADLQSGNFWHICNFGWVNGADVEVMEFD